MKKVLHHFFLLSLLVLNEASANDLCSVLGFHEPGTNIYDGPTFCENVTLKNINVRGPLTILKSKITGVTEVSGPLTADQTTFSSIILDNIGTPITVQLKTRSIINKDITFLGIAGKVMIEDGVKIYGKIINGVVGVIHQ